MCRNTVMTCLLLALVPAVGVAQDYGLGEAVAIAPSAIAAGDIAVGDLTGDGRDDVLVLSTTQSPRERIVRLYARTASGFATPVVIDQAADDAGFTALRSLRLADVDGDGDLDILLLRRRSVESSLVVLRNDAGGYTRITQQAPQLVRDFHVVDVDGDDAPDVVMTKRHSDTPVLLGDGQGGFTDGGTIGLLAGGDAPSFGDIDGDGRGDFVYAASNAVWVRLHGDDGYAGAAVRLFPLSLTIEPQAWAFGDFDGNGLPDIAMHRYNRSGGRDLMLHPQQAPGRFRGAIRIGPLTGSDDVIQVDLDGSGTPDLLARSSTGNGPLAAHLSAHRRLQGRLELGTASGDVRTGDLDGDGITDLVVREVTGAVAWMPGIGQRRGIDLAIAARFAGNAVVIDVVNSGTGGIQTANIGVALRPRMDGVVFEAPPAGCVRQLPTYMACSFPTPAPGASRSLALPFALVPGRPHEQVAVLATVSTAGDVDAGNNDAFVRGQVGAAPARQR